MNYKFPEIRTIDDVLPHIEGRSEFIVAEREFGTVINYVVAYAETFDMTDSDDLGGAIRRECRGIKFYPDGRLAARPFHKFFNVNEREETQMNLIDLSQPHEIMEKADGSMIHGIIVDSEVRLCTKMGITDIAMDAERYLALTPDNVDWLECRCIAGITDLFEWVSPENKIVLDYAEKDLIYLGSRINITGEYFFDEDAPFTKVARYGSIEGNLADYISKHRADEGREGFIIRFIGGESNGQMFKGKNDWYVRIHKVKDLIRTDRNIAAIIINEELDDVLPILDETDIATVRAYEARFDAALENVLGRLEGLVTLARVLHGGVKKDVAINFIPNLIFKEDASFIFSVLDGKDLRSLVIEKIKRDVGNTTKYEALCNWMEM
jgi:RNA ligase